MGGKNQLNGVDKGFDIKRIVLFKILKEVDAGQVTSRVVEVHVFRTRVRAVDAAGVGRGVPLVDGGVELHAGVGALPGGFCELAVELAGFDGLDRFAGRDGLQIPVVVIFNGLHELVGDADRIIGVLVLDAKGVLAVEAHIPAE